MRSSTPRRAHTFLTAPFQACSWQSNLWPGWWLMKTFETFLPWGDGTGFIDRCPTPRHCPLGVVGRTWRGCLLRMSGPIPRPRGCSKTGHCGCDPPTGWHRRRLSSSLPHAVLPRMRWQSLRTTIAGPMFRCSGPFLCPLRTHGITTPCKSTRQSGEVVSRNMHAGAHTPR